MDMYRYRKALNIATLLAWLAPASVASQGFVQRQADFTDATDTSAELHPGAVFAGAGLGSFAGLWGGFFAAMPFILEGPDHGGPGAVLLIAAGSVVGTTLGIEIASGRQVPLPWALVGSLLGVGAGLATVWLFEQATAGSGEALGYSVGFSLGQGACASAFSLRSAVRNAGPDRGEGPR